MNVTFRGTNNPPAWRNSKPIYLSKTKRHPSMQIIQCCGMYDSELNRCGYTLEWFDVTLLGIWCVSNTRDKLTAGVNGKKQYCYSGYTVGHQVYFFLSCTPLNFICPICIINTQIHDNVINSAIQWYHAMLCQRQIIQYGICWCQ